MGFDHRLCGIQRRERSRSPSYAQPSYAAREQLPPRLEEEFLTRSLGRPSMDTSADGNRQAEIQSLIEHAAMEEFFANRLAVAASDATAAGGRIKAESLWSMCRQHRIKAMLVRGRVAVLVGHELPEAEG